MRSLRILPVLILALLTTVNKASATHLFGADFFYTHVSGNTYNVTLWLYGDCSGLNFPTLVNATPLVEVYNGLTPYNQITLTPQTPIAGVEVTPVCPQQLSNTSCSNPTNPIIGVKKFIYSGNITLSAQSASWRFVFSGTLSAAAQAGRSGNISNIWSGSLMVLEATLNNIGATNSSPTYTTIPTPFFSVNKATNYNSGTVDPGDSLVYALVPGLNNNGSAIQNVQYTFPYTATQPLSAATGTFSFSTTTGQLSFTPNISQRALVVYKVSEYRNGTLRGTSMREMTFVVEPNNNNPPGGNVSSVAGGTAINGTTVTACQGPISFSLNPTDADGDNIDVQWSGLPAGASFIVTGNNTASPQGTFSWNVTNVPVGSYTFFVTYTDNGCPLSSKQTVAYTVIVQPAAHFTFTLLAAATCTSKAAFMVTHTALGTWNLKIYQGTTIVSNTTSALPNINDSLVPGTYTFRVSNSSGCTKDTVITIINPTTTKINISIDRPTCNKFNDGTLIATGYNSTAPYLYSFNGSPFSANNVFSNITSGSYTLYVKDAPGCIKDTMIVIADSLKVSASAAVTDVLCNGDATGALNSVANGGHGNYKYALNAAAPVPSGNFTNLQAASYALHIEDVAGCFFDTVIVIAQPSPVATTATPVNVDCFGNASGSISINATGGVAPHSYSINNAPYVASGSFSNLVKGTYLLTVKDGNGCLHKDTVTLTEPPALYVNSIGLINPRCTGDTNGVVMVNISGGTPPFTFAANNMPYQVFHHLTSLPQGTYVVHIKDVNGCIKDSTVTLTDPPHLGLDFTSSKALCYPIPNGSVSLIGKGGTPPYVYAVDQSGYTTYRTTYSTLVSGPHTLYVKDDNECVLSVPFTLGDSVEIDGGIESKSVTCYGLGNGEIVLNPTLGFPPYKTSLNDGNLTRKFRYTDLNAGNYTVTIKDTVGCMLNKLLTITQPATLALDTFVTHSSCYSAGGTGIIKTEVLGGTKPYKYTWSTGAGDTVTELTGLRKGEYYVRVVDANSCRDSALILLEYTDCCTPLMANAFTPNGDGKNDLFRVVSQGQMQLKAFAVFNRFGQRVFYTTNINEGWDGSFSGNPAEVGTYFYHVTATCGNSNEHAVNLKGDIILVR